MAESPVFHHATYAVAKDEAAATTGYGSCFRWFCLGWDEVADSSTLLQETGEARPNKEVWIVAKLKKLPELVAGPKWKNNMVKICYSRRFNNKATTQFQYSPESYALNFAGDYREEDDGNLFHSFSTRFAPSFSNNDKL